MYKFIVAECDYQPRLTIRDFVRQQGISLTEWRRIKSAAVIRINGIAVQGLPYLNLGDELELDLPEIANDNLAPEYDPIKILFEDEHFLIVSKPSGVLVHPTVDDLSGTLGNQVMGYYQNQGYKYGFKPIMRLDRQTSGIVIIAKSARVQHLMERTTIRKIYLALMPNPDFDELDVIKPIARKLPSIIEREVNESSGKYAHTRFKTLWRGEQVALVQAELFTGRTHQIRVHAAWLGLPLLGDDLYGGDMSLLARQALHAYIVEFDHPITKQKIKIIDELPEELQECLNLLR